MIMPYPWYRLVDEAESLEQGDFVDTCPVFIPEYTANLLNTPDDIDAIQEIQGMWYSYNVVVMSQSCDLEHGKLQFVVVCPHWSFSELGRKFPHFLTPKIQEDIRRGYMPGYYMLNECHLAGKEQPIRVVEFGSMFTVPFTFLQGFADARGKRLRLLTPYREKMARAFGDFFGRIALPDDIPPFRTKK